MGNRARRRKPTRRQKIAIADMQRVTGCGDKSKPRLVACGTMRRGAAQVTHVDFAAFSKSRVPDLDQMSDLGRGVVIAIADRMGVTPDDIIEKVRNNG